VYGRDWAILLETTEDPMARTLTRRIVSFRRIERLWRRADEVHRLRLYRPGEVLRTLRIAGFRARMVRGYGSMRFLDGWVGFMARKPPHSSRRKLK
jgi:hypothetical protein